MRSVLPIPRCRMPRTFTVRNCTLAAISWMFCNRLDALLRFFPQL